MKTEMVSLQSSWFSSTSVTSGRASGAAVDLVNNELIVGNSGNDSVTVYSRTASGNTAPLRTISGVAEERNFFGAAT